MRRGWGQLVREDGVVSEPATFPQGARRGRAAARPAAALRRELDHRMANSLQLAADFLLLQHARIADPYARSALVDAAERLVAVGHLHRFLCEHDGDRAVPLAPFLEELAALVGQGTGLRCHAEAAEIDLPAGLAQQLGLAINELAINAAKHAYARGEAGALRIAAEVQGRTLNVTVADHGRGLRAGFTPSGPGGLGLSIIQAIARQLGATLEAVSDGGARFTLHVPLPAPGRPETRSFAPRR